MGIPERLYYRGGFIGENARRRRGLALRHQGRRELARTLAELRGMAMLARMGLSRMWKWR
jgi:hypothetical protein